jgi:hypothetical protein
MLAVLKVRTSVIVGALACALFACTAPAADSGATVPAFVPVARSALVILEATRAPALLTLRARRASGPLPLAVSALTLSVDGHSVSATAHGDGTWTASWPAGAAAGEGKFEAVLAHDGIRELLSGTLPAGAAAPSSTGAEGLLGNHKQMAWWILNIAIVLIAVIAISRRMS